MSSIKKVFQPIVSLLEANPDSRVSKLLDQVRELASAKSAGGGAASTFHKDEAGNVVAIRCYYHGLWMHPTLGDFGKKTGSASGYNSMCKDGLSKWTAQQRAMKKAKDQLLADVASQTFQGDVQAELANIEAASKVIVPREDGYGFATLENCLADNTSRGI